MVRTDPRLQLTLAAIAAIDVWAILDNLRAAEVIGGWLTDRHH